jgi:hypothetical protein
MVFVKVQSFCTHELGSKQHNKAAPTPQNAKCNGRSVWDIMLENEDFKGKRYSSSLTNNSTKDFCFEAAKNPYNLFLNLY